MPARHDPPSAAAGPAWGAARAAGPQALHGNLDQLARANRPDFRPARSFAIQLGEQPRNRRVGWREPFEDVDRMGALLQDEPFLSTCGDDLPDQDFGLFGHADETNFRCRWRGGTWRGERS